MLLIFHSKAARFSFAPKCSHELALTCTGQNINGAMDDGLIMKPESEFEVDVHVNGTFLGLRQHVIVMKRRFCM